MKLLHFILLLVLSVNVSWSYVYDADLNVSNYKTIGFELQNQYYEDASNLCYSGRQCINSYSPKKTKDGSFFAFKASLVASKGGRGQQLGNSIKTDGSTTASQIKAKAESLGFKPTQTANGPLKFVDENGVARATIKGGSQRAPGSARPHIELKTSSGQRVNPAGEAVTRKSLGNHTPIKNDL